MNIAFEGFDWDNGNDKKCQKHGVSIEAIETFFKQDTILVAPDIKHSDLEKRFLAIGRAMDSRPLFIVFTFRIKEGNKLLRPISARYMHQKEIEKYEKDTGN